MLMYNRINKIATYILAKPTKASKNQLVLLSHTCSLTNLITSDYDVTATMTGMTQQVNSDPNYDVQSNGVIHQSVKKPV